MRYRIHANILLQFKYYLLQITILTYSFNSCFNQFLSFVFRGYLSEAFLNPLVGCAIVCGIGAVISQIGDLAASGIKRNYSVKDYGHLIPGHGGIMDRFDSVIFVAPAIYFLTIFINKTY